MENNNIDKEVLSDIKNMSEKELENAVKKVEELEKRIKEIKEVNSNE